VGTKLYVGNLNYNTTEDRLREAFGANGRQVTSVSIIMDRETGRPRGFAFVEMATDEAAKQALSELDGQDLDGRMLRINEAREREARGPGGPRPYTPRPAGPGGYGGAPSSEPPRPGGYQGSAPAGPGGYGNRPSGSGAVAPRFGPPAAPAGERRKREGKDKDRERSGGDGGKKKRRDTGDDGW
jgi:RNA recognition motif-containing protein